MRRRDQKKSKKLRNQNQKAKSKVKVRGPVKDEKAPGIRKNGRRSDSKRSFPTGREEDRVNVTVLEQASKGLFGLIGARDAKVELELLPDGVEEAMMFLREVSAAMELTVSVERVDENDAVRINITGSDLGILIGRRGQTLDSLQYLVNIVANRHSNHHLRIVLDAEQFRERRRQTLEALAERMAMRVVRPVRKSCLNR